MPSLSSSSSPEKNFAEWALFLLVALCAWHGAWMLNHQEPYDFLRKASDNLAYYQYLPAVFKGDGLERMPWVHVLESGKGISLVTCGVALLELPFFLLGDLWAHSFGYNTDGYSPPYAVANMLCAAVYAGMGCVLAFRLARRFSDNTSALLAVISLFAGTNLYYYAVHEPGYSHVFSFFLVAWVCWSGLRLIDQAGPRHILSFVLGSSLLILVRQLNVFVLLFPLIMAAGAAGGLKEVLRHLMHHKRVLILSIVVALVPWVLQMMYWKLITGDLITFAYGKKGEHFEWDKMVPGMVLFSVRNGWLVYSPLLIPALGMLVTMAWKRQRVALAILLITALTLLTYSAWWCWWLGTSYGARGMVDLYALLSIPLAWLIRAAIKMGWSTRLTLGVVMVACIRLNFGLMERFDWLWSWHTWTWQKYFYEVSRIVTGSE
jgi:hypothetical protein